MKITGLRVEKYIGKEVSGHNMDFTYTDVELEKHIILGLLEDNRKVEIELYQEDGECGSGWTTATFGYCEIKLVDKFNGYTHNPIKNLEIDDIEPNSDIEELVNDVFSIDSLGRDHYYPTGSYHVNMELFKPNPRYKDQRPTYIFTGQSGIGKSFLASKFNNDVIVFETDAHKELPESIIADVIVVGNKYNHTIKNIISRTDNTKIVKCTFEVDLL